MASALTSSSSPRPRSIADLDRKLVLVGAVLKAQGHDPVADVRGPGGAGAGAGGGRGSGIARPRRQREADEDEDDDDVADGADSGSGSGSGGGGGGDSEAGGGEGRRSHHKRKAVGDGALGGGGGGGGYGSGSGRKAPRLTTSVGGGGAGGGIPASGPVAQSPLDVAIDPDEPTYCTCQQVSFGEMIACDNDACPIEWFHQSCVGFKSYEKLSTSLWYCPLCRGK